MQQGKVDESGLGRIDRLGIMVTMVKSRYGRPPKEYAIFLVEEKLVRLAGYVGKGSPCAKKARLAPVPSEGCRDLWRIKA